MRAQFAFLCWIAGSVLWVDASLALGDEPRWRSNWLTVSDRAELHRTWSQALVFLPPRFLQTTVKMLAKPNQLTDLVDAMANGGKLPTILYLHSCEGLGHHREDLQRLAKLDFVVIAPNSFAREYRPLGCNEEREKFIRYFDLAAAFQKAELDYAVQQLSEFSWIDRENLFLIGSGMGGMVAAHYAGEAFAGHVIEGWGCRGPNPMFDGIWSPTSVRIFSAISRNDPWYRKNPGFGVDCESFLRDRPGSVSIVLDRPAHYVSWYPKSYAALIRFLTRDMDVDSDALASDTPTVVRSSVDRIKLREKWSHTAVREKADEHCSEQGRKSRQIAEPRGGVYEFVCE